MPSGAMEGSYSPVPSHLLSNCSTRSCVISPGGGGTIGASPEHRTAGSHHALMLGDWVTSIHRVVLPSMSRQTGASVLVACCCSQCAIRAGTGALPRARLPSRWRRTLPGCWAARCAPLRNMWKGRKSVQPPGLGQEKPKRPATGLPCNRKVTVVDCMVAKCVHESLGHVTLRHVMRTHT